MGNQFYHDPEFSSFEAEEKFMSYLRKKYGVITEDNLLDILKAERPDIVAGYADPQAEIARAAELRDAFAGTGMERTAKNIRAFLETALTEEEKRRLAP